MIHLAAACRKSANEGSLRQGLAFRVQTKCFWSATGTVVRGAFSEGVCQVLTTTTFTERWSLKDDLEAVFQQSQIVWPMLRGAQILMTGGTGFIGCWLLETLSYADSKLDLRLRVTVLVRNWDAFVKKAPHLARYPAFEFVIGDVTELETLPGDFTHVIHAATDASAYLNEYDPARMLDVIITGTRRTLDLAVGKSVRRFLFLSSGAIYGQQPAGMDHISEDWSGSLDCANPRNTYAEGKRTAEMLCAIYAKKFDLDLVTARIFTLLGPYMPLGTHFAAGNFILDAISGKDIVVKGNGAPRRSYLYAGDLANWLWHILARGQSQRTYNVGSDADVSIADLAACTSRTIGSGKFSILGAAETGWNAGRYVPDTTRARSELGLHSTVPLSEAIRRTATWNGWQNA